MKNLFDLELDFCERLCYTNIVFIREKEEDFIMKSNQTQSEVNISFMKGIASAFLSVLGVEGKQANIQKQREEELEKELEEIRKEEEKIGATKRMNQLRKRLQEYDIPNEKAKAARKSPKMNSSKVNAVAKQPIHENKKEEIDREIGD